VGLLDFKSSKGRQKPSLVGSIPTRFRHLATNRSAVAEDSDSLHCSREDCEAVIDWRISGAPPRVWRPAWRNVGSSFTLGQGFSGHVSELFSP